MRGRAALMVAANRLSRQRAIIAAYRGLLALVNDARACRKYRRRLGQAEQAATALRMKLWRCKQ